MEKEKVDKMAKENIEVIKKGWRGWWRKKRLIKKNEEKRKK